MASTYSNLKIQLMTTGENSTTWGSVTNTNLGTAIEEAIVGSADVTFSSGDETLTLTNTNSTQPARNMRLNLTGSTGGSTRTLTVPDIEKVYIVNNGCADAIEIANSTGSNVSVPAGKTTWVYSTGSNVVDVITSLSTLSVGGSDVVTESATQTLTNKTLEAASLGANTTATTQSAGDNSTKIATTAYVDTEVAGLGTISTQDADSVNITGGTIAGAALAAVYPVGSIYINASDGTNPGTLLGFGTWVAFGAGRVPVGIDSGDTDFDTAEETGGSKTHTLTENEMPSHNHSYASFSTISNIPGGGDGAYRLTTTRTTGSKGGDQPHNNVQPYIVVYMWKRTA